MTDPSTSDEPSEQALEPAHNEAHDRIAETRAFFAPRAATWDEKFPDDDLKFAAAVEALELSPGQVAVDVGCGTGRALTHLAAAVGPTGTSFGLDVTVEMCSVAKTRGVVVVGDAVGLPLPDGRCDGVFAAGLLTHLPDPRAGLVELARVTRAGGRLALFHPIGRAALAARRGHALSPDDVRDPVVLPYVLAATGWTFASVDDSDERYLAVAVRSPIA